MSDERFQVVVIGGGLAGLSAGVHLAAGGIPPVILEADSRWIGGRLAGGDDHTFTYQGKAWSFAPDYGMHALWGNYANTQAMLDQFTDTCVIPSTGEEWINRWGREVRVFEAGNAIRNSWIPAPFHYLQLLFDPSFWVTITPWDFLSLPGFLFSMLWAVGYDPIAEKSALSGLDMDEFFRGWTPNLRASFRGLGVNLLAAPAEEISLSAFIAAMRFYTVLHRDSWQMHYLPENSNQSIIQPLLHKINDCGGMVLKAVTAQALEHENDCWRIIVDDDLRKGQRTVYAEHIILAVDASAAKRLLYKGQSTQKAAQAIDFPDTLSNVIARMWFDAEPRDGSASGMFTGDFLPDNFFWLHRMYDDHMTWHEETGGSSIEVHIYGNAKTLSLPDRNLLIMAVDEVQRAFPKLRGHFVHGNIQRNSRVHTQFRVPTKKSLHVNTPWDNIYACGDWIGFASPALWMERATVTGIAAANRVLVNSGQFEYEIYSPQRPEMLAVVLGQGVRAIRMAFNPFIHALRRQRQSQMNKS